LKLAYHATEKTDLSSRPRWAVLFAGKSYLIFFLDYVMDNNDKWRLAMFCSSAMDTSDHEFPVTTAALYMTLTSSEHLGLEQLRDGLEVWAPAPPPSPRPLNPTKPLTRSNKAGLEKVGTPFIITLCTNMAISVVTSSFSLPVDKVSPCTAAQGRSTFP